MPSWRLDIEYDGTRYAGWQQQKHMRTIQGELIRAAEELLKTRVEIGGAGRTDAGVHASGQVAHLRSQVGTLPASQLQTELNKLLPADIHILNLRSVNASFHARHDAIARYYLYQISTRRTAFGKPYVWWVRDRLKLGPMKEACRLLGSSHDFRSFCESPENLKSTLVKVDRAELATSGSLIMFRIAADHFLWKMVRRLVGTLVEIGRGKLTIARLEEMLQNYTNEPAAWTAPPSGLFLERIVYKGEPHPAEIEPVFPIK
jgi:tRNA pseudouridine38-40 synthase